MPSFGARSRANLNTCDPLIQEVMNEAIKHYDFSVIDGHRDMQTQNEYYNRGVSQVRWPNSKHNTYPSRAVDIIPYPDGFDAPNSEFDRLATYVLSVCARLGVDLEWGGHWKNFKDYAHYQLRD